MNEWRKGASPAAWLILLVLLLAVPAKAEGQIMPRPFQPSAAVDDSSAYAQRRGWFSRDKGLHFGISAVGAGGIYALSRQLGMGRWTSAAASALVVGTVGVLREVLDVDDQENYLSKRFLSRRDLAWDAAGIVVGISATDFLFQRGSDRREERAKSVENRQREGRR